MTWLITGPDSVTIEIVASPNSQHRGLLRIESRGLVIAVSSPAEKGRANDELIATIAELAVVSRSTVSILRGASARTKVIRIKTVEPAMLAKRLSSLAAGPTRGSQKLGERKTK